MKVNIFKLILFAGFILHICMPGNVSADMSQLISMLMNNLNVSKEQANGGAGAVFGAAKDNMSPQDFSKVSDALPGVNDLIASASKMIGSGGSGKSGVSSMLGGLSGTKGSAAKSLGGLSSLTDTFSKLGLDPDMVGKYVDKILQFSESKGGKEVMNLLKNALL
jgi:hypothetical protein